MSPSLRIKRKSLAKTPSRAAESILHVSRDWVEWHHIDNQKRPVFTRHRVEGNDLAHLVSAGVQAMRKAGGAGRPCTLAMGHGLVMLRILTLPQVQRKDLKAVLQRKAARLLDISEQDVLFSSIHLGKANASDSDDKQENSRYLIAAMRREEVTELYRALRKQGVRVRRMVSARLARLCTLQASTQAVQDPMIAIDIGTDNVSVSLAAGSDLINQSFLDGNFEEVPSLGFSLVQEIRSFEAFWRRFSRGGNIAEVVLCGLSGSAAEVFIQSLQGALPNTRIHALTEGEHEAEAGRLAALRACLGRGPFSPDLTVRLPPSRLKTGVTGTAMLAAVAAVAFTVQHNLSAQVANLQNRAQRLESQSAQLESFEQTAEQAATSVKVLEGLIQRTVAIGTMGIDTRTCLQDAVGAFGRHASLMSLSVDGKKAGGQVEIAGKTHRHPLVSIRVLEDLRTRLEQSASFRNVEVEPPTTLEKDGQRGPQALNFEVHAEFERGR